MNRGLVLLDCILGLSLFFTSFTFATIQLSYFFNLTQTIHHKTSDLLTGIQVLSETQQGITNTNHNIMISTYDSKLKKVTYTLSNNKLELVIPDQP